MRKKPVRAHCSKGKVEGPPIPPGFVSLTSFVLKKVQSEEDTPELEKAAINGTSSIVDVANLKSSLGRKPWILYDESNQKQDESHSGRLDTDLRPKACLPKGVIRGCPECSDCVKVTARWQPKNGRNEFLRNAPVFHPTEEEFTDTVKYIKRIRAVAEPYGVCRIVPPSSWQPPCPIREKNMWERSQFVTKLQRIDGRQNQYSEDEVASSHGSSKRRKIGMGLRCGFDDGLSSNPDEVKLPDIEDFDSETGPRFTLGSFKKYADSFKNQYFCQSDKVMGSDDTSNLFPKPCKPSVESIESEYRRIVENPTEEIEVMYGADLIAGEFGSGFPTEANSEKMSSNQDYLKSGWNLNNTPRLPGSLLCFESCDTSGILIPRLHIGMCFSSHRWKVEDHHLYSMCYMHFGDPKVWYGIPRRYAMQVAVALRKRFPSSWIEQPRLRQKLITQLSPSILKSEGIHTYRCVQRQGEFVLIFPGAYHSGFDCGFNCVEVANYATIDWLPYGQNAIELYCEERRKTSISYDKLLLGAAREAVRAQWEVSLLRKDTPENQPWKDVSGKDGILAKALKLRVKQESRRREYLCASLQSQKMDKNFDATRKRECCICHNDLHLSAVGCPCSADKYSCLLHAKQLCSCAWSDKIFLFRYNISELNILVEAVEQKLSAVYRWAREDLGFALNPVLSKENSQQKSQTSVPTSSAKETTRKEQRLKEAKDSFSSIKVEIMARLSSNNLKPNESTARDSFSSIKEEIMARLSSNNLKPNENRAPPAAFSSLMTAIPSAVPNSRIGIGTRLDALLRGWGDVVSGLSPDSASTSSSSDFGDTLDVDSQFSRKEEPSVSPSVSKLEACLLNKEDEDVPT